MKRRILNILFIGIVAINFNGCFLDKITCDDETVQKLVEEIVTEDEFNNYAHIDKFVLSSFITTNKNKDLRKVECKAISNVVISGETYNFDVEYTAQLTDDSKEVYVELSSLHKK